MVNKYANSMVIFWNRSVGFTMKQYGSVCEQYGSLRHSISCNNTEKWCHEYVTLVFANSMVVCYTVSCVTILRNGTMVVF